MIAQESSDKADGLKPKIVLPTKVLKSVLGGWGYAKFPNGIEEVHRAWLDASEGVSHSEIKQVLTSRLFRIHGYSGHWPQPVTQDQYMWADAFSFNLPCFGQAVVLFPYPSGVTERHIALHTRGAIAAPKVDEELEALMRDIVRAIED